MDHNLSKNNNNIYYYYMISSVLYGPENASLMGEFSIEPNLSYVSMKYIKSGQQEGTVQHLDSCTMKP